MAEKSLFDENPNVSVDTNLPIEDILTSMIASNETETKKEETIKTLDTSSENNVSDEKPLSPLEKLKQDTTNSSLGLKISNDELKKGEDGPKRNFVYNDERMESFKKEIDSYDDMMKKRNAVMVTKKPENQMQYIELISEIDSVTFDENGVPSFNLPNGEQPKWCRLRTADEEAFDYSEIDEKLDNKQSPSANKQDNSTNNDSVSDEKRKMVNIIIDKTGLGSDFAFSDEEKEKIREAETIKVTEVKYLDINAIKAKRSNRTFQETIGEFNIRGSRMTMCFPSSGFRAQMKGLTYGEYSDIAISTENITFDRYYKRLSILYNKMSNISTGKFESFEDFLKNFAYTDIPLAIYGMYIATEKDNQDISLNCGNNKCNKTFDWSFTTRSLLRLERCSDKFLEKMNELSSANAIDFDKIRNASSVKNSKFIELPDSKIVVEMGIASAYDFLYNFIPLMNPDTFKEAFSDDWNDVYMNNMLLLTSVRSVYVPTKSGEYVECTGYKDILDAIYNISLPEIQLIASYASKIQSEYEMVFSFENVKCPHCGNVTKHLDIAIDDLVFQTYQRLMSTEIDLSQIRDF